MQEVYIYYESILNKHYEQTSVSLELSRGGLPRIRTDLKIKNK